ncbi:uncharacterized protein N7473_012462 [Penicillium subrubescens]|uniref:Uncharacterized protein n=1 Tax=Penicillium subrubescens TaxID=1316194 RepID=A0A1Q5SRJ6_9EURO|nr:uncharacterized protein N7473_012462 [Penicillium subrubescens]KAJ5875115.1 hypothetical protein N7473_012462 [Penicillium subrubescens]OKO90610.1 hypothetical protein PENSUB_13327 [Penicillium subrubescens]
MIPKKFMSYFTLFSGFDYDVMAPISIEFGCIVESRDWRRGSKAWRINWHLCMVSEYQVLIGRHANELATWQGVCKKTGLEDDFTSIAQCTKALDHIHLNIIDLIDLIEFRETDNVPQRFSNGRD